MIEFITSINNIIQKHDLQVILFDMDDTLYPEYEYVLSGFFAVAQMVEQQYMLKDAFATMKALYNADRQRVFNRLFESFGIPYTQEDIQTCIRTYKEHTPDIALTDGVKSLLKNLKKEGFGLGLITDGNSMQQHRKIEALCLEEYFDHIIVTDDLGGTNYRKPHPQAFAMMQSMFDIPFEHMAYIGDNPAKDFAIRQTYPLVTVHVMSGNQQAVYSDVAYLDDVLPQYILKGDLR